MHLQVNMNAIEQIIQQNFQASIAVKTKTAEVLIPRIAAAVEKITQVLLNNHKILACGNGGSHCDAQHFASEMINRFEIDRPSLPALALGCEVPTLTAIANDYHYEDIFAKQIRGLGQTGDLLMVMSTSGQSANLLHAIDAAHSLGLTVLALTGRDGGELANRLKEDDLELRIPADNTARIQETHLLVIHNLCDLIDQKLFGEGGL